VVWGAIALALALLYRFSPVFDGLKQKAVDISSPLYWLSDLPTQAETWADNRVMSRTHLVQENNALRSEMLVLRQKLQKNASLEAENLRLRQLLNASEAVKDHVLIAELIGVTPDPQVHKVMINRGSNDGVYVGQAVLDAFGLMGQIVEVGSSTSVALLITDASHALPVQVNRNGVRLVAEGVGDLYSLKLRHVANTLDIVEGDLLVSSGLGQLFPAGYPVAEVTAVDTDDGKRFARVTARPRARMNRSRYVLLVFETMEKDG
jgi:rod shape-determining protein MreC